MQLNLALEILRPGAWYRINSDSYEGIEWMDSKQDKPTKEEVEKLVAEIDRHQYAIKRKGEYPPFEDYLDARVHELLGDAQPMMHYLNACAAVKRKYPKP